MTAQFLVVSQNDSSRIVELNRPESLNALNRELLKELTDALEDADLDPAVRCVIVTGSQTAFSTGLDLRDALQARTLPETLRLLALLRKANGAIEACSKPVVAVIRGYCLTGGLELALACDLRIAEEGSTFGITSARIGSVAGAGGTQRLPRLVGSSAAKDLLLSARFVDAAEAYRIGLVDRLCDAGKAMDEALQWASVSASCAPLSVWLSKWAVNTGLQLDLASALDFESIITTLAFGTDDRVEGMNAFLAKRMPNFRGQ